MTTKITEKNISSLANAGVNWQSVITADGSTGTTGVAGRGYFINTTSAAHIFTLPATATFADTILIKDYAGTFGTNALTIDRNGHNIQGVANNSEIGTNRASVTLVYVDVTRGWEYVTESNVADLGQELFITATGGTITTSGNFKIHTFTNDGCFAVSQVGNSPTVPTGGPSNVDYLVVAGGGAGGPGGGSGGGGAGAGGFREGRVLPAPESYTASPLVAPGGLPVSVTTYPITVGAGAASTTGTPSVFSTITSAGGGSGGTFSAGGNGGSGGGGGGGYAPGQTPDAGGTGNSPPVSPSQGNNGGTSNPVTGPQLTNGNRNGGGGGGAGAAGTNGYVGQQPGPCTSAGSGGTGVATSISGSPVYYAGGGGGAKGAGGPGQPQGGSGGGGNGSVGQPLQGFSPTVNSTGGTANTGGGGGAVIQDAPGYNPGSVLSGGKGIVIIRYKFQ